MTLGEFRASVRKLGAAASTLRAAADMLSALTHPEHIAVSAASDRLRAALRTKLTEQIERLGEVEAECSLMRHRIVDEVLGDLDAWFAGEEAP